MKIATIIGARPQFVKAAPVSEALANRGIEEVVIHTGQHYDHRMSQAFFDELNMQTPHVYLGLGGGSHASMTGRMLLALEETLMRVKPSRILVYGDTNSTLAGALAASKLSIPIAHVEAGLRAFDRTIPEEINRVITDHLSDRLYTPNAVSTANLAEEGIPNTFASVQWVGDVMLDAALRNASRARPPEGIPIASDFILATIHRGHNADDPTALRRIAAAFKAIQKTHQIILPVHPRTRNTLKATGITMHATLIEPTSYLETLWLLQNASIVITDSGGLQKEAFFFGKPCVTLRETTEWIELLDVGRSVLVGNDTQGITAAATRAIASGTFEPDLTIYGNGMASERIAQDLT